MSVITVFVLFIICEGMKSLMFKKPSSYKYDPKKALEIKKYNFQDLESKKSQAYKELSESLASMVSGVILFASFSQKPIYLKVEKTGFGSPYHSSFSFTSTRQQSDLF
jgi:hypothetical protein